MEEVKSVLGEIDALMTQRKFPQALELAQQAMRKHPGVRPVGIKLAEVMETCKQYKPALGLYKALQDDGQKTGKTEVAVVLGLGRCFHHTDQHAEAEKVFEHLYEKFPTLPDVLTWMAVTRRHKGQLGEAEDFAKRALAAQPGHKRATYELAQLQLENKETDSALKLLESNIRRPDLDGDSIDLWMSTLDKLERNRYAQDTLEELARQFPNTVEFVYGFAVLANRAGEITLARPAFEQSMVLSPNNARILYDLAVLERISGNLPRSQKLLEEALKVKPDNPAALRTYGSDTKYEYGDANFKRLNYVAANITEFSGLEQLHLHYAVAKAYEDVGELDTAFRHYGLSGEKKRKLVPFNEKEAARLAQIVPKVVTAENLRKSEQRGFESDVPVFILGMPRSGTSLMEQILSSHPDIFGAGELKFLTGVLENIQLTSGTRLRMGDKDPVFDYDLNASWELRGQRYVDKLIKLADKPYKRIVDKMPGNFNFVGLIHAILPNAKIIHSRRHPVETCLSCYRIHFAEGHQWSYNLRELGRFYKRYWNLMNYYREEFPGVMYEVRYEENVADVEGQARKLIEHLGLEWNEACLEFYNTDRPVKTASLMQVRKPIYTTSTNRWRKYEKYLGPLLEELGDIVPAYEAEIAHLAPKS